MVARLARALLAGATILSSSASGASNRWFVVTASRDFKDARAQLQVLVDEHATQHINRFCLVGETVEGSREAWVYWPNENKLILWLPDLDNPHAIAGSKRYLDLGRDVTDGNDVGGSTYRLTRATANTKIHACRKHGEMLVIAKSTPG